MKKYILIILSFLTVAGLTTSAQTISYIIPDIGAPGMNTYVEIIAPVDELDGFGPFGLYLNNPGDNFRIETVRASDKDKIVFGPCVVGWRGRLISTQVFVHPSLRPNSSYWDDLRDEFRIPFRIYYNGSYSNVDTFYIVRPYDLGDLTGNSERVLGAGSLGRRSRRGAMIVTSTSFGGGTYTVSTNDCDPYTPGNQGYLPFVLVSDGLLQGMATTVISVSANGKNGGPGGGGGGGKFCDAYIFNRDIIGEDGGNGFTAGGPGGRNNSGGGSPDEFKSPGTGTGGGGASLNRISPPVPAAYEASGGGTGHPFGRSGEGCGDGYNCDPTGQYGGGSGYQQNQRGGAGGYRTEGSNTGSSNGGKIHGNIDGIPLAGGSGGASGNPRQPGGCSGNGGGGGGAIRIVAESIQSIQIRADGADGGSSSNGPGGSGSGGTIELGGKLNILNCDLSAAGGSNGGGRGLLRIETPFSLGMTYSPSGVERGKILTTDTTRYVYKKFRLTGSKNANLDSVRLYIRSEHGNWRLDTVLSGLRSIDLWQRNYYLPGADSIYYICAIADRQYTSTEQYGFLAQYTMSQAAANVILRNKIPEILSDTVFTMELTACPGNSTDKTFMIYNTGDAALRLDFQSATFLSGGNGFELVRPKSETWVMPNDSVEVVVRFSYQPGQTGIISDTLLLSHNDILAYNQPHKIAFTVNLLNLGFDVTNTSLIDIDTLYFGQVCYNEKSEKRFWINNKSDIRLEITQSGPNLPNFVLMTGPKISIPVNDHAESILEFTPDRAGMFSAMLIISSDTCNYLTDTLYLVGEAVSGEFSYQLPVDIEIDTLNVYENCVGGIYSGHFLIRNFGRQRITYPKTFSFKTRDYDLDAHSSGFVNTNAWDTVYFDFMPLREGVIAAEFVIETNECGGFVDTLVILCRGVEADVSYTGKGVFDVIPVDYRDTITVWLHNNGTADVYIESLEPLSPPFSYIDVNPSPPLTLMPGDSIKIDVEFYPLAEGEYNDTINTVQILKDSVCIDDEALPIMGIASDDDLILSSDTLRFGVLEFCDQKEDSLIITNPTSVTVKFSNARIAGPDASYFEISQAPLADTIPPNSQVVFFVRFKPKKGPDGQKVAQFLLDTDFPKEPTITVELRGIQENLRISMTPPEINFGSVPIGVQAVKTITLTNNGVIDQNLIDVKLSNPDMTAFPMAAFLPGGGGSVDIDITFKPTMADNYDTEIWFIFRKNCTDSISTNIYAEGREGEIIVTDSVVFDLKPPCADVIDSSLIVINSGASQVIIDSMLIVGPDRNLFTFIDTVNLPQILDSAETLSRVLLFSPGISSVGIKTAQVLTYVNVGGKTKIDTTYLRAEKRKFIAISPQLIDFGDVIVGRNKTLNYTITNSGNSSVIISGIIAPAYNEFVLNPDPTGNVLSVGETMTFDMTFSPTVASQYMDQFGVIVQYITDCEDTTLAGMRGNGIAPVDTRFVIGTLEDIDPRLYDVSIPIKAFITNNNTDIQGLEFTAMISFNATLFAVKSIDKATILKDSIDNNRRFVRFNVQGLELNSDTNNIVATIHGRPLLGNAVSTGINWNEFNWAEAEAFGQTDTIPGKLSIIVCEAGGQRLLNPGLPLTMSIAPNPASEVINIKATLLEVGKHAIELYDLQGRTKLIKEIEVTLNSEKEIELNYDVSNLPTGFYLIILKSPTDRIVRPVYILK